MILLWGEYDDPPFASVVQQLRLMRCPILLLSSETLAATVFHPFQPGSLDGELVVAGSATSLADLSAAYLRPGDAPPSSPHAARSMEAILAWADRSHARVMNRPSAMAANNSKPYQARLILEAGFATPDLLITTDPDAVREFRSRHTHVIYKSISGVRSIVSRLTSSHEASLNDVGNCPTMFQQYISGTDYRVHVVGDRLFPCRIVSSADDYRYPQNPEERPVIEAIDLDPTLADRVRNMVRFMDLLVAGVDLRQTEDGEWYCFEVNPSPAFTYFAQRTAQRIHSSVAHFLATGNSATPETEVVK